MKKLILNTNYFFALLLCLTACQQEVNELPVSTINFIFKDEVVKIPKDFPIVLFEQTQEKFEQYYLEASEQNLKRLNSETSRLSYDDLINIIKRNLARYPVVNYNRDFTNSELERIYNDFPNIRNRYEIEQKIPIIFEYYNTLCKNDVMRDVLDFEQRQRGSKTNDISPDELTVPEKNVLMANPGFAVQYSDAASFAGMYAVSIFGSNNDGIRGNAFKHALWNALCIRYILKATPASENQAIDFTQDGTSAHEKKDDGTKKDDIDTAMDLHNNMSARVWMEQEVKWGIGPFRKMPSENDIVATMHSKANAANFHSTKASILNLHGGDNLTTWNNLFNNMYGSYEHLIYINN